MFVVNIHYSMLCKCQNRESYGLQRAISNVVELIAVRSSENSDFACQIDSFVACSDEHILYLPKECGRGAMLGKILRPQVVLV